MIKVLLVTNMYPGVNPDYLYQGNFVKEQVESIERTGKVAFTVFTIPGFLGKHKYLQSILEVSRMCRTSYFDVIHAHYGLSGLFLLNPMNSLARKTVLTLHGGDALIEQGKAIQVSLVRSISKRAKELIVVNEMMQSRIPRNDSHVIPCGIDLDFFRPGYGNTQTRVKRIAFGGNPDREVKDFDLYRSTIKGLKRDGVAVEEVIIHGMDREQVREALCGSDCLLLTSKSEGSPQIVKESIACGTPVVSVDVGDVSSILSRTGAGLIVKSRTPDSLASAIMRLPDVINAGSPTDWRDKLCHFGYDEKSVAEKVLGIYRIVARTELEGHEISNA